MFSVLISLYYKEQPTYLIQSLDSILLQTLVPDEIVLVKDGALTQELDKIVSDYEKKCPALKVVPLKENQGLGKALNEGLKHCTYDLVARMDTDDISYKDRFEKQVRYMEEHPEIDACSGWIDEFVDSIDNVISIKKVPEYNSEIIKYAKSRSPLNHAAVIYRKSAVLEVGGYYGFPEDYNLWARMLMNGSKFYNMQESIYYCRYSLDLIKRRGGIKYAIDDIKSQWIFYRIGFINFFRFIYNTSVRVSVRLIPSKIRILIYSKILRK